MLIVENCSFFLNSRYIYIITGFIKKLNCNLSVIY
jgi:hypothetical protein